MTVLCTTLLIIWLMVKEKMAMRTYIITLFATLIMLIGSTAISGCATTKSTMAAKVLEADENVVSQCKYLGDVTGTSGWGNLASSSGINNAKNEALEQATKLGATHVVWKQVSGGYSPYVNGRAYCCK